MGSPHLASRLMGDTSIWLVAALAMQADALTVGLASHRTWPLDRLRCSAVLSPPSPHWSQEQAEAHTFEHGRDPHYAPPWLTLNHELLNELSARSATEPHKGAASASHTVGKINSLDDLDAALQRTKGTGRLVVVKFYAPKCRACLNIKPLYERASKRFKSDADFYEVDASCGRVLCALAGIKPVPVVHVYKCDDDSCELKGTKGIKDKARFLDFTRYAHTARPQRAAPAWS